MKRLLWLGVGLAVGALVVRAVSKKAQSYSPQGIAAAMRDSGRNAFDSVRDFVDDVRDGMHEREHDLHTAFLEGRPLEADEEELEVMFAEPGSGLERDADAAATRDPLEDRIR